MRRILLVLLSAMVWVIPSLGQSARVRGLQTAAASGDMLAQFSLGLAYEYGNGVERDISQAAEWYRRAADRGLPEAQNNYGRLLMMGLGVTENDAEAMKWFRRAAAERQPD